jgi:ribosome maturation factor RimP
VLDVEDAIRSAYNLEVSSPGLDRPLKTPHHFRLASGLTVRVKTRVPIDGENFFVAPLLKADDEEVVLSVRGAEVRIPYRHIRQARLEVQL